MWQPLLAKIKKNIYEVKNNNKNKPILIISLCLIFLSILSIFFTSSNGAFYNRTIAKIITLSEKASKEKNLNGKQEPIKNQQITATIMNGTHKGSIIKLQNKTSFSQVSDLNLKVNDEVFVSIQENSNKQIVSSSIIDLKRDKYIVYITMVFILLTLLIGGFKGFKSLTSVVLNSIIFFITIQLFLHGFNLVLVAVIASFLFIVLSILIVSGVNKKTLSAIIGTIAGTIISMLIAVAVIKLNHWEGIHFEEMEFLTHSPENIFIIEILIGTLGGIMDIAISISSAIQEICEKTPHIETKKLVNSAMAIGKDIMGTMSNTLVFAYLSGSIPILLLLLRNGYSISYIVNINLSLEIIRALTGSIGIVLSIPITIYTSVMIFKKYKIGEV